MKSRFCLVTLLGLFLAVESSLTGKDFETVELVAPHLDGMTVGFNIILPRGYDHSTRRYPVLYLLHGYTDHYPAWVSYTNLVQYARDYEEIIVMPEGDNGWYTNNPAEPKLAWEDFIMLDLMPYVDSHYRTVPERPGRAIAGLSMGGYGAMKLALKYPQMFAAAASLSGALASARWKRRPIEDPGFQKLLEGIFGPPEHSERAANDPFELVKKIPAEQMLQHYISTGSGDFLLEENREFVRHLAQLKIPYRYREFPGKHEWSVWDREIHVVLELQAPVIGALPQGGRRKREGSSPCPKSKSKGKNTSLKGYLGTMGKISAEGCSRS